MSFRHPSRKAWPRTLTLTALMFVTLVPAARSAAPSRARTFGVQFAHLYNQAAAMNHWPGRIVAIACEAHPKYGYACNAVAMSGRNAECIDLLVDPGFDVLAHRPVRCSAAALDAAGLGGPKA